jgi:hypothetical protein
MPRLREASAGREMPKRAALCEYRADMMEVASLFGFKTFKGGLPCVKCRCTHDDMHERLAECSLVALPWPERSESDFVAETMQHIVPVHLADENDRSELIAGLRFYKGWPYGRNVVKQLGRLGLRRGDRLCAVPGVMPTICDLESVPLPRKIYFFRPMTASSIASLPILWDLPGVHSAGVRNFSAARITDDVLHVCDLGISQRWAGACRSLRSSVQLRRPTLDRGSARVGISCRGWEGGRGLNGGRDGE